MKISYDKIPQYRICEFCGEEFVSHHGLQRYCPEKYGRKNFCKNEQKKLVNERKLADMVQDVANALNQVEMVNNQLNRNIKILGSLIKENNCIKVSSITLDKLNYDMQYYTCKKANAVNEQIELEVGPFVLEWIDRTGEELIFYIRKA